jgi:hypothetical protein
MAQQTTLDEWAKDPVVDPEIRAHIYSLVNAVSMPQFRCNHCSSLFSLAALVMTERTRWETMCSSV